MRLSRVGTPIAIAITVPTLNSLARALLESERATESRSFDWSTVEPSTSLKYHGCYGEFQCARLSVPLDWNDENSKRSVAIAIIKLPATVPETDAAFGGTIITNPGGPGGSGVSDLLAHGHYLRWIVDGERHYDILSFDPRGVFHSTPRADCFGDELARRTSALQQRENGHLDSGNDTLKRRFARAQAFGAICENEDSNPKFGRLSILAHMSTASVSRDLLEIVDKTEELRHKELSRQWPINPAEANEIQEPKLQYIGFSYGTQLGNTFASMFPNRVGRMVLDGNVYADDYAHGMWTSNLRNTEEAVLDFYDSCFKSSDCPLRSASDTKGLDIKARVDQFLHEIHQSPLAVIRGSSTELITSRDILATFQIPIYMPMPYYEELAVLLADLLDRNYTRLLQQMEGPLANDLCLLPDRDVQNIPITGDYVPEQYTWSFEAALTYICGDGNDFSNVTIPDLANYIRRLEEESPTLGATWAEFGFLCSGWKIRPWRFNGPFGRAAPSGSFPESQSMFSHSPDFQNQQPLNKKFQRPLAAPVLFLSSTIDPVTPLANAFAMSALHPGSSVVIQNSVGHCATYSSPSSCTKRHVEKYFDKGILPQNGTTCEADCKPWDKSKSCRKFEPWSLRPMRQQRPQLPFMSRMGKI